MLAGKGREGKGRECGPLQSTSHTVLISLSHQTDMPRAHHTVRVAKDSGHEGEGRRATVILCLGEKTRTMAAVPRLGLEALKEQGVCLYTATDKVIFVVHCSGRGLLAYSLLDLETARRHEEVMALPLQGRGAKVLVRPLTVYRLADANLRPDPLIGDPGIPRWFVEPAEGPTEENDLTVVSVSAYHHAASLDRLLDDGFKFSVLDAAVILRDLLASALELERVGATHGDLTFWNCLYIPPFRHAGEAHWASENEWGVRLIDIDQSCTTDNCTYDQRTASVWPLYFGSAYVRGGKQPRGAYVGAEMSQIGVCVLGVLSRAPMDAFINNSSDLEAQWQAVRRPKGLVDATLARRDEWLSRMRSEEGDAGALHRIAMGLARGEADPRIALREASRMVTELMAPERRHACGRLVRQGIDPERQGEPNLLRKWQTGPRAPRYGPMGRGEIVENAQCEQLIVGPSPRKLRQFVPVESLSLDTLDQIAHARREYQPSSARRRRAPRGGQ